MISFVHFINETARFHESVVPELDKNVPRVVAARGKE